MNPSNFNLQCDIYQENLKVFIAHLKIHIQNKCMESVKYILNKVKIPDEILCYKLLRTTSEDIVNLLLSEKLEADEFIFNVLQKIPKDGAIITADEIRDIVKNVEYKNFSNDYKLYIILSLLGFKNSYSFLYTSIICAYKTSDFFINFILCDGIYNANIDFITHFLFILMEKNINFEIQPTYRKSHMEIVKWLMHNLKKGMEGAQVGWTTGPDSGVWPSSNPEDYEKTFKLIQSYITF